MKLHRKLAIFWAMSALAIVLGVIVLGFPYVVAMKRHRAFVGAKPKAADVVGTYILSDVTVIPGVLSAPAGRQCVLHVFADGTFSLTGYPECDGARSSKLKQYNTFHSTSGTWELAILGTSYGYAGFGRPKDCWGLSLSGTTIATIRASFTGPEPPYDLLMILDDPDSNITLRFKKIEHPITKSTLSSEGAAAKAAARAILQASADENEYVRKAAAEALPRLSTPDEGLRVLIAFLADESPHVRQWATRTLAGLGAAAKPAIPAMTEALKDTDVDVRFAAAEALVKLGVPGRVVPALIALLEDKRWYNRRWAAEILGDVGPPAKAATPALTKVLKDESEDVRKAAAEALKKIQPDGSQ